MWAMKMEKLSAPSGDMTWFPLVQGGPYNSVPLSSCNWFKEPLESQQRHKVGPCLWRVVWLTRQFQFVQEPLLEKCPRR